MLFAAVLKQLLDLDFFYFLIYLFVYLFRQIAEPAGVETGSREQEGASLLAGKQWQALIH
jgi:hypothetical protein